jgi:hypothetical protein
MNVVWRWYDLQETLGLMARMAGRKVAHQRRIGDHEVCDSLESLLTDSQSRRFMVDQQIWHAGDTNILTHG